MVNRLVEEISSRKLEALVAYLQCKTLSGAADALHTSPVSVHRALHSLEDSLRCTLFRHEGRGLVPTEAAFVLAAVAEEVLGKLERGIEATRTAAGYSSGRLKIGSLYSLTSHVLPELIKAMSARKPELQCELVLGRSRHELLPKLKAGELDAVFAEIMPADVDLVSLPMFDDAPYFAVPFQSKHADAAALDLAQLAGERIVTLADGPFSKVKLVERFPGFKAEPVMEVEDIFAQMNLVASGFACAVVPGRIRAMYAHSIRFVPLNHTQQASQTMGLCFMRSRERDPNLLTLSSVARLFVRQEERSRADAGANP